MTRIFFTSDVHGSDPCFMKFINAAKFYKADVLILGPADLSMVHVGSMAVRRAIETHDPLLGLHGHITNHEASLR